MNSFMSSAKTRFILKRFIWKVIFQQFCCFYFFSCKTKWNSPKHAIAVLKGLTLGIFKILRMIWYLLLMLRMFLKCLHSVEVYMALLTGETFFTASVSPWFAEPLNERFNSASVKGAVLFSWCSSSMWRRKALMVSKSLSHCWQVRVSSSIWREMCAFETGQVQKGILCIWRVLITDYKWNI